MQNSERPHGLVNVAAQQSTSSYFQRAAPPSKSELQNRGHHLNDGTPRPLNVCHTRYTHLTKWIPGSESEILGLDFGGKRGQDLPKQRVQFEEEEMKRDFRITKRLFIEYGIPDGLQGL